MDGSPNSIDEYMLARFIANRLSEKRRHKVIDRLYKNSDLRELLHMSVEALNASKSIDQLLEPPSNNWTPAA